MVVLDGEPRYLNTRRKRWPKNIPCRGGPRRNSSKTCGGTSGIMESDRPSTRSGGRRGLGVSNRPSYWHTHWPMASEIATQYLLLLLCEMKSSHMLRFPYRAVDIPPEVAKLLPVAQQPAILAIASEAGTKRARKTTKDDSDLAKSKAREATTANRNLLAGHLCSLDCTLP